MLTRASVHWADRMVATRSWKGFSCCRAQSSFAVPGILLGQALRRHARPPLRRSGTSPPTQRTGLTCAHGCAGPRAQLDAAQLAELAALLTRCERADRPPRTGRTPAGRGGPTGPRGARGPGGAGLRGPGRPRRVRVHHAGARRCDGVARGGRSGPPDRAPRAVQHELLQTALLHASATGGDGPPLDHAGRRRRRRHGAATSASSPNGTCMQMRVPLPLRPRPWRVRARSPPDRSDPGRDDAAWLSVNNRAFADHPEQGRWTLDDLHEHMKFDLVRPRGIPGRRPPRRERPARLVLDQGRPHQRTGARRDLRDLRRPGPPQPGLGPGPDRGRPAVDGEPGVSVGMLYVTGSNTAAVTLYGSLGFTVDHVDRSYLLTPT